MACRLAALLRGFPTLYDEQIVREESSASRPDRARSVRTVEASLEEGKKTLLSGGQTHNGGSALVRRPCGCCLFLESSSSRLSTREGCARDASLAAESSAGPLPCRCEDCRTYLFKGDSSAGAAKAPCSSSPLLELRKLAEGCRLSREEESAAKNSEGEYSLESSCPYTWRYKSFESEWRRVALPVIEAVLRGDSL